MRCAHVQWLRVHVPRTVVASASPAITAEDHVALALRLTALETRVPVRVIVRVARPAVPVTGPHVSPTTAGSKGTPVSSSSVASTPVASLAVARTGIVPVPIHPFLLLVPCERRRDHCHRF